MYYKKTVLHLPEGDFENELLFFDKSDKKTLRHKGLTNNKEYGEE
tara:strand:- start:661 stop:795 length:135 start_codon:yes stop_codon:yes gene_type:complete